MTAISQGVCLGINAENGRVTGVDDEWLFRRNGKISGVGFNPRFRESQHYNGGHALSHRTKRSQQTPAIGQSAPGKITKQKLHTRLLNGRKPSDRHKTGKNNNNNNKQLYSILKHSNQFCSICYIPISFMLTSIVIYALFSYQCVSCCVPFNYMLFLLNDILLRI